ncbi:MAG: 1-acyl-sn-glycerol-3-phosphate acyltransferase [Myxococcota bacterium]|nr:1-acyl-sn-glycerol-3-phosphate acyltransferase [Myxococcota bacterium]
MPSDTPPPNPADPSAGQGTAAESAGGGTSVPVATHVNSAMVSRFNLFFRFFAKRFFGHFDLEEDQVARLRDLESRGAVVYVMRYSSRLDYLLLNTLFLREGLRLSSFANGIRFTMYRPVLSIVRNLFRRKPGRSRAIEHGEDQRWVRRLTRNGDSFFLFLRTQRLRTFWRGLWRMRHRQDEMDLIQEVVRQTWASGSEVFVVPISLFWRKGPRASSRFLNLDYGSLSRPSDLAKVSAFLLTYRSLSIKIGEPIDLADYIEEHRDDGQERVARTVRRSILIHLYREEKVVEGPTLRSSQRVLREIMADQGVREAIKERASQKRGSAEKAEREAEKIFREIAARMNSTLLAAVATVVGWIIRRLFSGVETRGLAQVAEYAKRHPLVLVPAHRSYLDFLLLSLLFYNSYLVPPHIAARDNMAFGPFGVIFRMAGAFYLRRSFEDPLYKQVFRAYVAYLVREGFTQEFFIEGGRSRTGKTLVPRLGMLGWNVDAFLESSRQDLFFVPIAITYERLVEESGIVDEMAGGKKKRESTLGVFRARKYLGRGFGSVHIDFGEPISLAESLGERRERFRKSILRDVAGADEMEDDVLLLRQIEREKREFVEALGNRLVESINWNATANATSLVSAALMGSPHTGLARSVLVDRVTQLVKVLEWRNARLTAALWADRKGFEESIAFMLRNDLVEMSDDFGTELIFYQASRRNVLDLYRNSIVHYLALPSFLSRSLLHGRLPEEISADVARWSGLFYSEFFVPEEQSSPEGVAMLLEEFQSEGWIRSQGGRWAVTPEGRDILTCLAAQTRSFIETYEAVFHVVLLHGGDIERAQVLSEATGALLNARRLGLAGDPEAAMDTSMANALDWLLVRSILSVCVVEDKRSSPKQTLSMPGDRWNELTELRLHLAKAASAL